LNTIILMVLAMAGFLPVAFGGFHLFDVGVGIIQKSIKDIKLGNWCGNLFYQIAESFKVKL
ncbi:MAG: hypothetical protein AAB723_03930, partial [Patescibacteria group bacterium]